MANSFNLSQKFVSNEHRSDVRSCRSFIYLTSFLAKVGCVDQTTVDKIFDAVNRSDGSLTKNCRLLASLSSYSLKITELFIRH